MSTSSLRSLVLKAYKKIHRTRMTVFNGDTRALDASRIRINEEFRKNKNENDEEAITTMIQFAEDVEKELRTKVIQVQEVKPGLFQAKIHKDTLKLDNTPYNDFAIPEGGIKGSECCQNNKKK